ncbi:hypothetical protein [Pseudomonas sichuanensis]|uniref:hypothetical protein n=1 Tax=Pseudomonas sichuanensis TaxID=2213015 RepID=UPI000DA64853|nr:hypothetical protein [Pseudomonas sichuanensis]
MKTRSIFTLSLLSSLFLSLPTVAQTSDSNEVEVDSSSARPALEILNTSDKPLFLVKRGKTVETVEAKATFKANEEFLKTPAILSWGDSPALDTVMPHVSVRGFGSLCEANACLIVK